MSHKRALQKYPTTVSYKSVQQECLISVSRKNVRQDLEGPTRVSYKRVSNVRQECPIRVAHKSVLYKYPTRVSYKSAP